jgi:hypothetical protein
MVPKRQAQTATCEPQNYKSIADEKAICVEFATLDAYNMNLLCDICTMTRTDQALSLNQVS